MRLEQGAARSWRYCVNGAQDCSSRGNGNRSSTQCATANKQVRRGQSHSESRGGSRIDHDEASVRSLRRTQVSSLAARYRTVIEDRRSG